MTINLDFDTSDDDSLYKTYLSRPAQPAPLKKRDVVFNENVFSVDSSDDDDEDAEIATLTGSQPLSVTDGSLDSPGFATQQSPPDKIVKSKKGERLQFHQSTTTIDPPTNEEGSLGQELKPRMCEASLDVRGLECKAKASVKNDQASNGPSKSVLRPGEAATKKKPVTKKPRKDQEKTKKAKSASPVKDIFKPSEKDTENARQNYTILDSTTQNPVTVTTVQPLDRQKHSKQRPDAAELNVKATKKTREKEADKMIGKSFNGDRKYGIGDIEKLSDVKGCLPHENESENLKGLKSVYAQVELANHVPDDRSPSVTNAHSSSQKQKVSDPSVTLPAVPITETVVRCAMSQKSSGIAKNSSPTVQPKQTEDVTTADPTKTVASKDNRQEKKPVITKPQPHKKAEETRMENVLVQESCLMDEKQQENVLQSSTDQVMTNHIVVAAKEDRSSKELRKKRKKAGHSETPVTIPLQTTTNQPTEDRSSREQKKKHQKKTLTEKSVTVSSQSGTKQAHGIDCEPVKASSAKTQRAPPKTKSQKTNFQDQVVNRLFWSFKPYMLRTLSEDVKATETTLEFCLLSLIDKGIVVKKEFTSSKGRVKTLYWANHDVKSKEVIDLGNESTPEDREKTKQTVQSLQSKLTYLNTELSRVLLLPSNIELTEQVVKAESELLVVRQQIGDMKDRIETWASSSSLHKTMIKKRPSIVAVVSSPRSLKRRINHMRVEWMNRKKKCHTFLDLLADGLEKKPKDVFKLLDIDTDELNDATLPAAKHAL